MKKLLVLLLLFGIVGCDDAFDTEASKLKEEHKSEVETKFLKVKEIPSSEPCKNLDAYTELYRFELNKGSDYYVDVSRKAINSYEPKCESEKRENALNIRLAKLKNNKHILGYVTGLKQSKYDCNSFYQHEDFGYICILDRSNSDRILFYSDPYTKLVGKIFRFILLDKEQVPAFKTKMKERYGEPDAMAMGSILRDLDKPVDEILLNDSWGWGDVKSEYISGIGNTLEETKKNGISVRLHFSECRDTWFYKLDCPGLFNLEENPNKVIAKIYMFGVDNSLNSSANALKRDPREPEKYETIKTDAASEIEI